MFISAKLSWKPIFEKQNCSMWNIVFFAQQNAQNEDFFLDKTINLKSNRADNVKIKFPNFDILIILYICKCQK